MPATDMSRQYKMHKEVLSTVAAASFALAFAASPAWAQGTVRVRGTIEKVEGNTFVVKSRDGAELKVVPADNTLIVCDR